MLWVKAFAALFIGVMFAAVFAAILATMVGVRAFGTGLLNVLGYPEVQMTVLPAIAFGVFIFSWLALRDVGREGGHYDRIGLTDAAATGYEIFLWGNPVGWFLASLEWLSMRLEHPATIR